MKTQSSQPGAGGSVDALVIAGLALAAFLWIEGRHIAGSASLPQEYVVSGAQALTLDGALIELAQWQPSVLLVNFWAPWCVPCRTEVPELVALQARYLDDLVVVGIAVDSTVDRVRIFAEEYNVNYPVLMADENTLRKFPEIHSLPTSFLIQPDGRIHQGYRGIPDFEALQGEIDRLIRRF